MLAVDRPWPRHLWQGL